MIILKTDCVQQISLQNDITIDLLETNVFDEYFFSVINSEQFFSKIN